jgi:hypothetical protein
LLPIVKLSVEYTSLDWLELTTVIFSINRLTLLYELYQLIVASENAVRLKLVVKSCKRKQKFIDIITFHFQCRQIYEKFNLVYSI